LKIKRDCRNRSCHVISPTFSGPRQVNYKSMTTPSHLGNVEKTADERHMVYITGPATKSGSSQFFDLDTTLAKMGYLRSPMP
jgi:hypothetical protein